MGVEKYVSGTIVVHSAIHEVYTGRILDALRIILTWAEFRHVEHEVMLVACVKWMMILEDLSSLLAPEISDLGCHILDCIADESWRKLSLDC